MKKSEVGNSISSLRQSIAAVVQKVELDLDEDGGESGGEHENPQFRTSNDH